MRKDRPSGRPHETPSPELMADVLGRCGIGLTSLQLDRLWTYHQLLREYNPQLNLSRIHNFSNMIIKLYADSILPGQLMELPSPLLDVGTGAGMPGIPLKIAYPRLHIILAESRQNRVEFLQMALDRLKLEGLELFGKGISSHFERPVSGVITRAVESVKSTLARVSGCLVENGLVVFMKGPHCDEEIQDALSQNAQGYRLFQDLEYQIPRTPHQRRLVVFQRIEEPAAARKESSMHKHAFRQIESEQNEIYKDLKKLLGSRGIRKQGRALVFGRKQVSEILRDLPERCLAWISRTVEEPPPVDAPDHVAWYALSGALFDGLDVFGVKTPLLLIEVGEIPAWEPSLGFPRGCSVLIPFQDPENVGAAIRSSVAFGAAQIILLAESAHPYHPKALRASGGTVLRAKLMNGPSIQALPEDLPVVALSAGGTDISLFEFPECFGLLAGVEGPGLPGTWRNQAVGIPIRSEVESLNAAIALAISLYVWSQASKGWSSV